MTIIIWDESYSVGIASIDEQHKKMFDIYNQLLATIKKEGPDYRVYSLVLTKLVNYTIKHFQFEEDLFREYHYPGIEFHTVAHLKLTQEVDEFQMRLNNGENIIGEELLNFLGLWLREHIKKEDMDYSKFLIAHGAK